jgi:hypothetical protein
MSSPMKYRKRPVVISAVEWNGFNSADLIELANGAQLPGETVDPFSIIDGVLFIATLEGTMRAERGDWIIRGVKDELYPCKPEIFAATYELAGAR